MAGHRIFVCVGFLLLIGVSCIGKILGGWEDVDVEDENVKNAAVFAVEKLNTQSNGLYHQKLAGIHKAQRQLVSGWKFKLVLEVGTTSCKKNEVTFDNVKHCEINENELKQFCNVVVWVQLWNSHFELKEFECNEKISKPL
ncbi:L-cystatin-like [Tachypleus tridentatus]|uniref:L-cystatin-like n=1 Tax=Tachypleus tridentatus TaxID=6853 RepID=UPI003FCEE8F7